MAFALLVSIPPRARARALRDVVRGVRFVWRRLPARVLASAPLRACGRRIQREITRRQPREQSHATWFLRNRPQLEVVCDLLAGRPAGSRVSIASVGCSTGAELYSLLWVLRTARPELEVVGCGADLSAGVVAAAEAAFYHPARPASAAGLYGAGIAEVADLAPELRRALFVEDGDGLRVRDEIRAGTAWKVADACDPLIVDLLGRHDVVLANNFLGPMPDALAEACLRNIVRLVKPGGYLVVDGIDADLKARLIPALGLVPVCARIAEIHAADPSKQDWPWTRWAHEPFDRDRPDWCPRYATIFALPARD